MGEPFVRKDFVGFLEMLSYNDLLEAINITTNGALISHHISKIEQLEKVKNINLSIDSLKPREVCENYEKRCFS